MNMCSVDGCDKESKARGWCWTHYGRWKVHGATTLPGRAPKPPRPCSVDGCARDFYAKGYCYLHWSRMRRTGTLEAPAPRSGAEHPGWVGDDVSYTAMHTRILKVRGRASEHECIQCEGVAAEWAYDYTDPSPKYRKGRGLYSTDPARYVPMCVRCHKTFDGPRGTRRKVAA